MRGIEVADLHRSYTLRRGRFRKTKHVIPAVRGISFHVDEGELFGLVGPNGAGKTTTIRILATLLLPDSGSVRILGKDVVTEAPQVRRQIGFLFGGERGLYGRVSAWANLRYFANLYGLPTAQSSKRIDELLELVGLAERARDRVDTFSRGMKQRLHIARALIHDPEVLYVDEPTIGLDPVVAREVRGLIRDLSARGKTILLTTHYMFEAEELCHRVAVINHGRFVACDTPAQLRRLATDLYVVEVELTRPSPIALEQLRSLGNGNAVLGVEEVNGRPLVRLQSSHGRELVQELPGLLGKSTVQSVMLREPTLEDVYVKLIGDSSEEAQEAVWS
jgi:ABC-2 type transport system ATP-binding protein